MPTHATKQECIVDYVGNIDAATIDSYVDQVKNIYHRYNQLSETEKGEYLGYVIGTYVVDILAGIGAAKGAQLANKGIQGLRSLRNANSMCNLEAMLLSETEKEAIIAASLEHTAKREAYLKNISIHWDRQNKHIPGKHNFLEGGGIIEIGEKELEALIKNHAGTGQSVQGEFLSAGYRERVDFGTIIGKYARQIEGQATEYLPTSKGIIHYDKKGNCHVIPSDPFAIME